MRPNRRLHSELSLRATLVHRVLPAPGSDLRRSARPEGFRLRARPRGVHRAPPSRPETIDAGTGGLGALRCERGRGMARFHDARLRFGESDDRARGVVFRRADRCDPPLAPLSPPSIRGADRTRSRSASKAAEIDSARLLVKRRRAFPIRGAFLRQARRALTHLRARPRGLRRSPGAHVNEDHQDPTDRLPFVASELTSACAP